MHKIPFLYLQVALPTYPRFIRIGFSIVSRIILALTFANIVMPIAQRKTTTNIKATSLQKLLQEYK